ncbi:alkaline serine protease [Methanosarcinales archaeon ex4572_44]|nr:MAG: alkaline serine protease [Methanosarcinales archaeon ex4484_138]PHP46134.1 MAG: alkaline serine protease [Methanosarcinales archaeon ex4572_44]RLG26156.1 MAG: peptidase S8 [Methanosarcinales archaeon]RLG26656.1 MAG: peptidase S8 [Methanosarcinales archaeon]
MLISNSRGCTLRIVVGITTLITLLACTAAAGAASATWDVGNESNILEQKGLNHAPVAAEYVPGEILVKFKPYVGEGAVNALISEQGSSVESTLLSGTKIIQIPAGKTVDEMVSIHESLAEVEYAEPNFIVHALMVPDDPYYSYQWHLHGFDQGGINMEPAWEISTGSSAVVAVIDTGVAYEDYDIYCQASDLAGTTFVQGYDYVNSDSHPNDDHRHGTHVAGTIAQTTNNLEGVAGVAFDCSIMPVKVLNATGYGTTAMIANAIYYATDNGADIISMSLGAPASSTMEDAVMYAYNHGVTVIAAAGNEYLKGNAPCYPAAYDDYVIAVGATRYDKTRSYYSNTGSYLDLVAPGGDTTVDQNSDGYDDGVLQQTFSGDPCTFDYWFLQGTSMATPHVSGVAALLIADGVTGPDNIRNALESTAHDLGDPGWDEEYGWGLVDAEAALEGASACGDVNCDGAVNMGDVILLLNHVSDPSEYVLGCCGD